MIMISFGLICLLLLVIYFSRGWSIYIINGGQVVLRIPVALTVSIMSGCAYCIGVYNETVKHAGLDDEALTELYSIIDTYAGLNRLNIAGGVKPDKKPWYGCGGK